MNKTITEDKAKNLMHKLKCSNTMFFMEYERKEGERKHILCKFGLKEDKTLLKHNYKPSLYDSLEVFNVTLQAFVNLSFKDVIYLRYNDIRYFVLPN